MKKCGFIFLLFLGISTYYASNVDAASLREDEKTCSALKAGLLQCAYDSINSDYCSTGTSSCFDKANEAASMGCTDPEIVTASSTIRQKCEAYMLCDTFKKELQTCKETNPALSSYCVTGTSSCLDKAIEGPRSDCTVTDLETGVTEIKNKCPAYLCDTFKNDLQACEGTDPVPAGYCATGASSCLAKANEDASKDCKDPEIITAVDIIEEHCKVFVACDTFEKKLDNCVSSTVNADYCSTGTSSCLDKAKETPPMGCTDTAITEAANRIRNNCQKLDKKCDDYWQTIKTNCAPDKADADYCDENVEGSCFNKLKFLNDTCPDKDPGDEGHKIQEKCDEPETTLEHCRHYLTAMFDCWNDEKLFPTSCSSHTERYKWLNCVNEAREQHEDKCNSDVTKQYNSNMVIFLNATDKFLCQGNSPQFDADCLDSTVSKDIIVSSFAGDMNECLPLLETIELFKSKFGKEKCKILVDDYIVEIKKLDYCHPKRVTSEPCEKDGNGNIQLNILIGHDIHANIGGMA